MTDFVRVALAVTVKDLVSEWRSRELVWSLGQFVLLALVIANFGFDIEASGAVKIAPGVLWLVLIFAGLVAFGRTFAAEKEQASLEAMLLTPAQPAAIFAGKAAAAVVLLAVCEAVLLPGLALLFGAPIISLTVVATIAVATLGMAVVGCLLAALAAQTRARELLLPVLALPLWIPLVVVGGQAVLSAVGGQPNGQALGLLLDFDILFVVVASLAARYVLDE
jgi:heme exporter protein B